MSVESSILAVTPRLLSDNIYAAMQAALEADASKREEAMRSYADALALGIDEYVLSGRQVYVVADETARLLLAGTVKVGDIVKQTDNGLSYILIEENGSDLSDWLETTEALILISEVSGLQNALDSKIPKTEKGVADGVATLDSGGKIPNVQLPPLAITSVTVVADQAARLALAGSVEEGDAAKQTDNGRTYLLQSGDGSQIGDWVEVGDVDILISDVSGLQAALDAKQATSEKGQANGYASLDASTMVPSAQLPYAVVNTTIGTPGSQFVGFGKTLPSASWTFLKFMFKDSGGFWTELDEDAATKQANGFTYNFPETGTLSAAVIIP